MLHFLFPRFPTILWKHCFSNKATINDDIINQLIDQLILLVEGDVINSIKEDQFCLSADLADWYDLAAEISIKNDENQDSSPSSREIVNNETKLNLPETPDQVSSTTNQQDDLTLDKSTVDEDETDSKSGCSQSNEQVGTSDMKSVTNEGSTKLTPVEAKETHAVISERLLQNIKSGQTDTRTKHGTVCCKDQMSKKRLTNRLDVSKMAVRAALAVVIEERGWRQDGARSKQIFDSIYETLGKQGDKIDDITVEDNCVKIYTRDKETRLVIMKELKEMNQLVRETSPYQLYVQNPLKPSIQFLCCAETYKMSSCDLITQIRNENNWKNDWTVNIESKEWIRKLRKAKLSLIIDSRIRDKIEMEDGIILISGKETKVFDKFGISQCSVCLRFGHSKCRSRIRCFFCSGFHSDRYPHDKYIEQKWCFLCRVTGHAPISKNCPALIEEIRSKLELIDHNYKEIFIGTDRSY